MSDQISMAEYDRLRPLNGFFVGSLDNDELEIFERAVAMGIAQREYQGAGALLGIAKVRIICSPKG